MRRLLPLTSSGFFSIDLGASSPSTLGSFLVFILIDTFILQPFRRQYGLSVESPSAAENPGGGTGESGLGVLLRFPRSFLLLFVFSSIHQNSSIAKTKVINSCLNPTWNEGFSFSLSELVGVLKLEVFDKDRFKADDKMVNAQRNLQPPAAAARLRQILRFATTGMTLRKVIPEMDNCLDVDSTINWENGELVQDVWLRLCDVEFGEIELKIKLIKLPL